jgi:hypothetical protein
MPIFISQIRVYDKGYLDLNTHLFDSTTNCNTHTFSWWKKSVVIYPYLMGKPKLKKNIALFEDTSKSYTHKILAIWPYYTWQSDELLAKRKLWT